MGTIEDLQRQGINASVKIIKKNRVFVQNYDKKQSAFVVVNNDGRPEIIPEKDIIKYLSEKAGADAEKIDARHNRLIVMDYNSSTDTFVVIDKEKDEDYPFAVSSSVLKEYLKEVGKRNGR